MGAGSRVDFSRACLLLGGSFSCCDTLAIARVLFELELFRFRCGELVALGMDINACLRVLVAMLENENVSCDEGGISTAAAIHLAIFVLVDVSKRVRSGERRGPSSKRDTRLSSRRLIVNHV